MMTNESRNAKMAVRGRDSLILLVPNSDVVEFEGLHTKQKHGVNVDVPRAAIVRAKVVWKLGSDGWGERGRLEPWTAA